MLRMTYEEANKIINPQEIFQVEVDVSGTKFVADFHRAKYYYYEIPNEATTDDLKNTWHVTYWQYIGNNGSRLEIGWNNPYSMAYRPLDWVRLWVKAKLELLAKVHLGYCGTKEGN
jgi:hypothetical protein